MLCARIELSSSGCHCARCEFRRRTPPSQASRLIISLVAAFRAFILLTGAHVEPRSKTLWAARTHRVSRRRKLLHRLAAFRKETIRFEQELRALTEGNSPFYASGRCLVQVASSNSGKSSFGPLFKRARRERASKREMNLL